MSDEISAEFAGRAAGIAFRNAKDIDDFFRNAVGSSFIAWFNDKHGGKAEWAARKIGGVPTPTLEANFRRFWDQYPQSVGGSIGLCRFLALMSIFINEVSGNLASVSERFGLSGHPGIAYLFDHIPGIKQSYNKAPNVTAGKLFRDPAFVAAHGTLALGSVLANTGDPVWDGTAYPQDRFPTKGDPALTGFVLQADFFKFRGRGLIQTTWRANYKPLIEFVRAYTGNQPVLAEYAAAWKGRALDEVATTSRTADWDRLFEDTDMIVVCEAINQHNEASNAYLNLAADADGLNATARSPGSLFYMGWRINGSPDYGTSFKKRVAQLCADL